MRLIQLEPKWIEVDGRRVGFVFRNPVRAKWWSSCFFAPTPTETQESLIEAVIGDVNYQTCNPAAGWSVTGGNVSAETFETISVTPSLDGGVHFWHGHITNGEIVGGLPT